MVQPIWAPGLNGPAAPNTARVRDYWLGGDHNSAADRELADEFLVCAPHLPYLCRIQREFLRRAVRDLVDAGIRQFLDLGSGLPTVGNVHEVAQALAPDAKVVYVDVDPVVAEESRSLLAGTAGAEFLQSDLRHPERVRDASKLLDFDQPVAVLMLDVLHFVRDADDPAGIVAGYVDALAPGSYLALTHTSKDEGLLAAIRMFGSLYAAPLPEFTFREPDRVAGFLRGLTVLEPGLVPIPLWRPDPDLDEHRYPENFQAHAAIARKP